MNTIYFSCLRFLASLVFFCLALGQVSAQNTFFVSGKALTTSGHPMADVIVQLTSTQQTWIDTTDATGTYFFDDIPENETYELAYAKNGNPTSSVDWRDMSLLRSHLIGLRFLPFYSLVPADVDLSNQLTTLDLIGMWKMFVLGEEVVLPGWNFVYAYAPVENLWPITSGGPWSLNAYSIDLLTNNLENIDFVGLKKGDVDKSAAGN